MLSIGKSPGWRPSFKYFHWSSAFLGALLCIGIMFSTDIVYAFTAIVIAFGIYKYIDLKDDQPSWGSAQEARTFSDAIEKTMKLRKVKRHVKNYRPSYLVMCGDPNDRPHLIYFGTILRQSADTMVVFAQVKVVSSFKMGSLGIMSSSLSVIDPECCQRNPRDKGYLPENWKPCTKPSSKLNHAGSVFKRTKDNDSLDQDVQGFFDKVSAMSVRDGHNMLIQLTGLGVLRPNVVVIGFKDD